MRAFLVILASIALTSAYGYNEDSLGLQGRAQYQFEYGVEDPQTGDSKAQREQRNGQELTGEYTLREADGTRRLVRYRAGPQSGFEAVVERVGQAQHPSQLGQGGFGQGYHQGYGSDNGIGGAGGSSFVGATQWRNQGFGGNVHYGQGEQGQGNQQRYGNGNNFGGIGGTSYVGPIQWRNQGSNRDETLGNGQFGSRRYVGHEY